MLAEDEDEEGFGDFKFAPPSSAFAVNPHPINGPDLFTSDDDDGWSDFVDSVSLSRTQSLPPQSDPAKTVVPIKILADRNELLPDQPYSPPARLRGTQWVKPQGALPLSIFGEEEEEGSGAVGTSSDGAREVLSNRDVDSVKNLSNLKTSTGINNLIASLHKHNDNSGVVNGLKPDSNGSNLDSNGNVWNSVAPEVFSDIFMSNSGLNGLDLAKTVSSLGGNKPIRSSYVPNLDLGRLDSNRSANYPDASKTNLDTSGFNFVWSSTSSGVEGLSSTANDRNEDLEDNDGWEFKAAEAKFEVQTENSKNDQIKVDNGLTSSSSGSYSAPDMFSCHLNQLNLNVNAVNPHTDWLSTSTLGENKSANADDWGEFTAAETKTEIKDKSAPNSNTNVFNSDPNGLKLKANGVHGDISVANLDLFDTNEDLGDADGWEFKHAESENQFRDGSLQGDKKVGEKSEGAQWTGAFGTSTHAHTDLFAASDGTSYKSVEWDFGFNFKPISGTQNGDISNTYSNHKQIDTEIWSNPSPGDGTVGSDQNSWDFKDAFSEIGSKAREEPDVAENTSSGVDAQAFTGKCQDNAGMLVNQKGALPLSLFGEEEQETDDSMDYQDFAAYSLTSDPKDGFKRPASNVPISDIISSLYSQAEDKRADDNTQNPQESVLLPKETPIDTGLISSDDILDDNSWEFKGAFSGVRADETFVNSIREADNNSTQIQPNVYVEFYSKLKDELQFVALCHLDDMKKSQSCSTISGEVAEVQAVDLEIQDLYDKLQHDGLISREVHFENCSPGGNHINEFVKDLEQPKFLILESEYNLSKKLLLAEKDLRSTIELSKHAASTLKILTLGSVDRQRNYVSIWSEILLVCSRELKHGALVWKQSLEKNLYGQILRKPQGKKYIIALGEVYRVVETLGSSAKLFKSWLLINSIDSARMSALLSECSSIWSSSGLEEALRSIFDPTGLEYDGTVEALLQSIKDIHDLNADALCNHVFGGQQTTCQLSLLTAAAVPGMKMVEWNGEHYFLTIANLWGNLISCDPPNLPQKHVG
ncbi:hypothetical protein HS088_TW11G00134 [Tripterygium wilfordii]|uniref:Synergin gamma C-terminal domain-containing protein n=1 Tax=Tripterygium wilfordii TaxID=458696 RepID=A0A7J7D173_TRIWF|nr:uncharacterized protein LOC120009569 [Tripterygium wilfordii]KAF5740070.1 hypothetical protein HS088_TW11G00134 [Tripterygium wilfordii]